MLDMFVQPVAGIADPQAHVQLMVCRPPMPQPAPFPAPAALLLRLSALRPPLHPRPYICPTHCPCCCRTQAPPRTVAYAAPAAIAPAPLTVSAGAQIPYRNMVHGGPQTQGLQTQELQTQELQTQELQTQELQGTMQERSVQGQQLHSPHDEPEP